ncbi:hypothetical protein LCGC14_2700580 [marine sediment metagenome]|uniref:Uncharacterized protein n=1 Tax=marine sediment metagenome TaxID=412755 RepID=A0A0F8ZFT7_9ZZZZ
MKTKEQIEQKIMDLDGHEISWTCSGITTAIPSAIAMIDTLKWVLSD